MLQAQQLTQCQKESSFLSSNDETVFLAADSHYNPWSLCTMSTMHMQAPAKFISNSATCPIVRVHLFIMPPLNRVLLTSLCIRHVLKLHS